MSKIERVLINTQIIQTKNIVKRFLSKVYYKVCRVDHDFELSAHFLTILTVMSNKRLHQKCFLSHKDIIK